MRQPIAIITTMKLKIPATVPFKQTNMIQAIKSSIALISTERLLRVSKYLAHTGLSGHLFFFDVLKKKRKAIKINKVIVVYMKNKL